VTSRQSYVADFEYLLLHKLC